MTATNATAPKQQLELAFPTKPTHRPARHQRQRRRRLPGAHWWFSQMRQAVANAVEWSAKTERATRVEQTDLLCPAGRQPQTVNG